MLDRRCWEFRHIKGRQELEECDTLKSTQSKSLYTGNLAAESDIP